MFAKNVVIEVYFWADGGSHVSNNWDVLNCSGAYFEIRAKMDSGESVVRE